MKKDYEAPRLRELGSLAKLTQQHFNKVGVAIDVYSQESNDQVVGSLIPTP